MTPGTQLDPPRAPGNPADAAAASADSRPASPVPFMVTKEHRRFAEFADAVRRDRYIGLCYGAPGVGQTLSARQYAGWDTVEPYLRAFRFDKSVPVPEQALAARSIVYTPAVANTPRSVEKGVTFCHTGHIAPKVYCHLPPKVTGQRPGSTGLSVAARESAFCVLEAARGP
jgi:hypothetical protein